MVPGASEPVVSARRVAVRRGDRVVLQVDSLDLGAGVVSLIGPNGSGKSTLLHAIGGLLEVTGDLTVLGGRPEDVRARVGYVLQAQQAPASLPITVREVVSLGRAAVRGPFGRLRADDRAAIDEAIERLDLGALADRHLDELSGGQRQRAFVAQGLAQRPELLLLDEPMAGLDLVSSEQIRSVLADERAAGHTVVVATHDLGDAAASDAVVLLAGRVVASGAPGVALAEENLRAAYGTRLLDVGGRLLLVDDGAHHHDHRPGCDHASEVPS